MSVSSISGNAETCESRGLHVCVIAHELRLRERPAHFRQQADRFWQPEPQDQLLVDFRFTHAINQ